MSTPGSPKSLLSPLEPCPGSACPSGAAGPPSKQAADYFGRPTAALKALSPSIAPAQLNSPDVRPCPAAAASEPSTPLDRTPAVSTLYGGPKKPEILTSSAWAKWLHAYSQGDWHQTQTHAHAPIDTESSSVPASESGASETTTVLHVTAQPSILRNPSSTTQSRSSTEQSSSARVSASSQHRRKKAKPPKESSLEFYLKNGYFQAPQPHYKVRRQRGDALRRFRLLAGDQRPTLARYAALAKAVFRADFAAIFMSNLKSASEMCIAASTGAPSNPCSVPISKTICGHAMLIPDQVLVVPDIREEWCFTGLPCTQAGGWPNTMDGEGLSFYASAPIRVSPCGPLPLKKASQTPKSVTIGRLCILSREPRHDWTEGDSELLTSIASMAGEALENDYLQHRAIKVSEMQRAMSSLARTLDEDREQAEENSATGLAAAMSAANARDGQFRICPSRVEQACKHLFKALHADSVTAVDLSTFKVSTIHDRRSTSGTTYPLTPWLPSPSPSHSSNSVPTESNSPGEERSQPSFGSSPEAGKATLPGQQGATMVGSSLHGSAGATSAVQTPATSGTLTATSASSSAGYSSFWNSQPNQPSTGSSRTSINGSAHDVTTQQQHQRMQYEVCAQLCDTETPKVVCHFGAPELAPQLDGILQKKSLSMWLTRWRRGRNALRPQLYQQNHGDSEFDSEEDDSGSGSAGRSERGDSGIRLSFFEPGLGHPTGPSTGGAEMPVLMSHSSARASVPSVGSSPSFGPSHSAHHASARTPGGTGPLPFHRAYSLGPIDGLPPQQQHQQQQAAYLPRDVAGITGVNRSASSTGSLAETAASGAEMTNPLGFLLPNARQYAALPIFPISRGNPVVLLIVTFLDEVSVEDSELLFFESVGAVLYSSLLAQQARAVDRAQLSLIRGLQHEFRTPLHGILGIVDAIQSHEEHGDNTITSDPALLHNLLESIRLASSSLNSLLDDVLTFGEITGVQKSGRSAPSGKTSAVDDLDLGDLIEEVALEELAMRKMAINQNEGIRASGTSHSDGTSSHGHSTAGSVPPRETPRLAALRAQVQQGISGMSLTASASPADIRNLQEVMHEVVERDVSFDARSSGTFGDGEADDGAGARTVRPGSSRTSSIREPELPPELVIDTLDLFDRFRCDRTKVQKALRKIVSNALRFTTRGVVKITARQRAEETSNKQIMVDIEIADTGPGMSQEFINNKLMEPFVKGSAFDSGVGLGNVIAASLVSQMGGHLHVASEVGHGTKITISLPLTPLGPNRTLMGPGGYACHAVAFLGCDNVGITSACDFLRKMLRSKNVLPVEEIGGLPDLLVISERVLNATYGVEAWEGSGLDDSVKKALLALPPHARVLVVSRGDTNSDRIDFGPLGARPIHVVQMPYGPSKLRALNDFLQQEKPFMLRPLPVPASPTSPMYRQGSHGATSQTTVHRGRQPLSGSHTKEASASSQAGQTPDTSPEGQQGPVSAEASEDQAGGSNDSSQDRAESTLQAEMGIEDGDVKAATRDAVRAAGEVAEAEKDGKGDAQERMKLPRSDSEERGLLAQDAVQQMAAAASQRANDEDFRVLVVEDNPINLKLLTTLCKRLKMKYEEAKDGVEAVVKYLSFRPSVVLLDISLPEQDGFQAAAQMRSHPPFTDHPPRIVAITALSSEADKIRGLTQCGMDIWLTKPVSTRALQKDLLEMESNWKALHGAKKQQQQQQEQAPAQPPAATGI